MPVMPDTRIALSGLSSDNQPHSSPFQTLGSMMQIKENQQEYQKRQRELDDDNATRSALMSFSRPEEAIDHLWKSGRSGAATKLAKGVYEEREAQTKAQAEQVKNTQLQLEQASQILGSATDDASYQTVRPSVLKLVQPVFGEGVNDLLPTTYGDGVKVKQLVTAGTSRALQLQHAGDVFDDALKGYQAGLLPASAVSAADPSFKVDPNASQMAPNGLAAQQIHQENLARLLTTATTQEEWDRIKKTAWDAGVPKVVYDRFGEWDANAPQRARDLGLTLEQRTANEARSRNEDRADERDDARDKRAAESDRRWTESERRRNEADQRRESGGKLTAGQRYNEQDAIDKEIAETEKFAKDEYDTATPAPTAPASRGMFGTRGAAPVAAAAPKEGYARLSPDAQAEYIKRRVASENKSRVRLQGVPPIEEAAKTAIANNDREGYAKLEGVYQNITNRLGSLSDIAPWPDRNKGVTTSDVQGQRRKAVDDIIEKLKDPTLTAAKRKSLQLERNQLLNASR